MSMVSICSLRPFYTFLYTIINGNVIASFVQKKLSKKKTGFETLWSKKNWGGGEFVRSLETPLPPCTQSYAFCLTSPFPLCAYVLYG